MIKRKLRIAYFSLYDNDFYEDFSINSKKYGGGTVFAKWAKELWNNDEKEFYIFTPKIAWEHIDETKENKFCFIDLPRDFCKALKSGINIKRLISNINYFDIILHGHTNVALNNENCRSIQVHWAGFGRASDGHPFIPYTFIYGPDLTPYYNEQKTFPIILGKPVPKEFIENKKEDFIFQCSRHNDGLSSIEIAKECIRYKIKGIFAGTIGKDYKLMDYINNINTFFLGEISDNEKKELNKKARLTTYVQNFGEVFNQSVIESLAEGTPVLRKDIKKTNDPTFRNWLKDIIIDNYNGVVYNGNNFLDCWERSKSINQKNCWETAKKFSVEEMMKTFEDGINFVIKDSNVILE